MRKKSSILSTLFIVSAILLSLMGCGRTELNLIPYPKKVKFSGTDFNMPQSFEIESFNPIFSDQAEYLHNLLMVWKGNAKSNLSSQGKPIKVSLIFDDSIQFREEAYKLSVNPNGIVIHSGSPRGCFYGIQTLDQLVQNYNQGTSMPEVEIMDYPNFEWRSYMLDESRHFFGKEFVLKLLDELAALKINKFHWHLTDDQGWRIEIKKYPLLTKIGSFRDSTQIEDNGVTWKSKKFDRAPHKGFYTQNEIKEIIKYAAVRGIDIIPEIEMPGHSSAAITAYPWLGVIGKLHSVPASFGKKEDSYNIADPNVVNFLHDVLDEVCDLFPYEVVHIGGDEVLFGAWGESEEMQEYIKTNQLSGPADAQIKFTNDISNYLKSKGKRMMGWNEILGKNIHNFENTNDYTSKTELSKNAIIQYWLGDIDMITSIAQEGYKIVNSHSSMTYLDYPYEDIPLVKLFNFSPIPAGLNAEYEKNIIGAGVQMWTEWSRTTKDVEYHTFPRIAGFAEAVWNTQGDYMEFLDRLKIYSKCWELNNINFDSQEIK